MSEGQATSGELKWIFRIFELQLWEIKGFISRVKAKERFIIFRIFELSE